MKLFKVITFLLQGSKFFFKSSPQDIYTSISLCQAQSPSPSSASAEIAERTFWMPYSRRSIPSHFNYSLTL